MPLTSSVFPVPRSPSRPMTSPASSAAPIRRPRARVSSTDAVLTEVLIAGRLQAFDPGAVAKPNPGIPVDLAHQGQWHVDAFQGALRDPHARLWGGADQLEILGVAHRQRPFLSSQAARQRKALDIDGRAEARVLHQPFDLTGQAVADVTANPDPRLDEDAPG